MADLESAVDYLMGTLISGVSGIKRAPQKPVESSLDFPIALALPLRGRIMLNSIDESRNLPVVRLAVHVSRTQGINAAVDQALPFIDSITDTLLDSDNVTWGGNIDTILADEENPITWEFGPSELADVETYAWVCDIPIKYKRVIS